MSKTGLSIKDIRDFTPAEVRNLSDSELRKVTQQMVDAANKRVKRMVSDPTGTHSRLAERFRKETQSNRNLFGINRNMTRKEIKEQFDSLRGFFDPARKTNTLAGFKSFVKKVEERIGGTLTSEQWKAYRDLEKEWGNGETFPKGYGSTEVQRMFVNTAYNHDEAFEEVNRRLEKIDEEQERAKQSYDTDFYRPEDDGSGNDF